MTRLKKELMKKHIIFKADDYDCMRGAEYDEERELLEITDKFIITVYSSAVLDSRIHIFDRNTYQQVGSQNLFPEERPMYQGRKGDRWDSYGYVLDDGDPEYGFAY